MKYFQISFGNKGNSEIKKKKALMFWIISEEISAKILRKIVHLIFLWRAILFLFSNIFISMVKNASWTCVKFLCSISLGFVRPVLIVYSLSHDVTLPSQFPWQCLLFFILTEFSALDVKRQVHIQAKDKKLCIYIPL